jgi:hypothetical protein
MIVGGLGVIAHFAGTRATVAGVAAFAALLIVWGYYVIDNTIDL